MRGAIYFMAAAGLAAAAFWTYRVNYDAKAAFDRTAALRAEIAAQQEAIVVLRAELAYLSGPDRLRALLDAQGAALDLTSLGGAAFVELSALPFPPPDSFWVRADPKALGLPPGSVAP